MQKHSSNTSERIGHYSIQDTVRYHGPPGQMSQSKHDYTLMNESGRVSALISSTNYNPVTNSTKVTLSID